jgi:hypothetical protein
VRKAKSFPYNPDVNELSEEYDFLCYSLPNLGPVLRIRAFGTSGLKFVNTWGISNIFVKRYVLKETILSRPYLLDVLPSGQW